MKSRKLLHSTIESRILADFSGSYGQESVDRMKVLGVKLPVDSGARHSSDRRGTPVNFELSFRFRGKGFRRGPLRSGRTSDGSGVCSGRP